jgi:hypothetical protein
LSKISKKLTLVRFAAIYLPIVAGLIFTATGIAYFLETSQTYAAEKLPIYGFINLASKEFDSQEMTVTINSISEQGSYADVMVNLVLNAQDKDVKSFGLQVPHLVENAFFKIAYMDAEKTAVFYDQGEGKVTWLPDKDVSLLSYEFLHQSGTTWYSVEVSFRWFNAVTRTGFASYEILVPFSESDNVAADASTGLSMLRNNEVAISLNVNLPVNDRLVDSIPQPVEEVISWRDSLGIRSLVFVDKVDFGRTPGYPELPSFRVSYEVPELRESYDRLIFNSGLFLGIGIQFLLAGIFDAIKLRDKR